MAAQTDLTHREYKGAFDRPIYLHGLGRAGIHGHDVDRYLVRRAAWHPELAAMGFTIPVVLVLFAIGWGFGTSVSSLVGRALGKGQFDLVQAYGGDTVYLAWPC